MVSEAWDEDIPEERKTLFGVHVVFKPMTGSETVQVEYQKNESGTWTTIQTEQASNTIVATIPVGQRPWNMALTPDGRKLYVANGRSGSVSVIDTQSNTKLRDIEVGKLPWGVVVQ